jgi:hypothetical protein
MWVEYTYLSFSYCILYLTLRYFTSFYLMLLRWINNAICTLIDSNDAVWAIMDVPIKGGVDIKLHLGVKYPPKTPMFTPECRISSQITTLD